MQEKEEAARLAHEKAEHEKREKQRYIMVIPKGLLSSLSALLVVPKAY